MTEKFALALSGGGAKGAYQIGLWKALIDSGIYNNITAFSGTSVGALNAVMMAMGDFEWTKLLWSLISNKDMRKPGWVGESFFSRPGFEKLLEQISFSKLKNSRPVYIAVRNKTDEQTEYVYLNDKSTSEIIRYLRASTAIPNIYRQETINRKRYEDAGPDIFDNVPLEPLYRNGHKNIWISALTYSCPIDDIKAVAKDRCPGLRFNAFIPDDAKYDDIMETINFSRKRIRDRMIQGYINSKKRINMYKDIHETVDEHKAKVALGITD